MSAPVEQQHQVLLRNLGLAFDLTEQEAATLAEALKRGGPLPQVMHWEIMVGHYRLKSQHELLADQLRDWLVRNEVDSKWVELLCTKLRPQWKYIYYILRDGDTYGYFVLAERAI